MTSRILAGLFLLTLSFHAAPRAAPVDDFSGQWAGDLTFRGDSWPVRLHVTTSDEGPRATLDLPDLVMAWEPIPALATGDGLRIELPFGFGEFELRRSGDRLGAMKDLESGATLSLQLRRSGPPPFEREEIRFANGDTTLTGVLVRPRGVGPHPAIILVHGAEPQGVDSWPYRSWADFFVRHRFATLYYDKREVAESTGDRQEPSLPDLTDDLLAAIGVLRSRDDIGPIGLCGGSQGGWVALLSAGRSDDIAFLILRSTAAVTPAEQELHRVEYGMRAAGFAADSIQDARAYLLLYFSVVHTGEGWPLLRDAAVRAQSRTWSGWVDQPRSRSDLQWWEKNHAFDPRPLLEALTIPALAMFGGADTIVPPLENVGKLRAYYGGDPADLAIEVFRDADHRGEVSPGAGPDGRWRFPRMADGLLDELGRWLARHARP